MEKASGCVQRRRSKVGTYYHLVWATRGREERLFPEAERRVHRCVTGEAERLRCVILALDGMPDHIHLVVRAPGTVCPSGLAKQIKGVSSAMLNEERWLAEELFRWQDGYGCFSFGRPQIAAVVSYVKNQKRRHAEGRLWPEWEEADEAVPSEEHFSIGDGDAVV